MLCRWQTHSYAHIYPEAADQKVSSTVQHRLVRAAVAGQLWAQECRPGQVHGAVAAACSAVPTPNTLRRTNEYWRIKINGSLWPAWPRPLHAATVFTACFSLVTEGHYYRKFVGGSESGPSFYLFPEVRKSLCIFRSQLSSMEISKAPERLMEGESDQTKT